MPRRPQVATLTNVSVDVVNAIRNDASINYQNYVPIATPDADSIRKIGAIIMDNPSLQNEFLNALIGRIGRVIVTSKMYSNPLSFFKKGFMEMGETVEEIFVEISRPFQYDPDVAESEVEKRHKPKVHSAFHILNYKKFYKCTVERENLRQAFLSWEGVTDLVSKTIEQLYSSAEYDELQVMMYLMAVNIVQGKIKLIPYTSTDTKAIVKKIKSVSNKFGFLKKDYNVAGVYNKCDKKDQYVLMSADFDAENDVEVLASAFNMDKVQFMGQRTLVDSFGSLDFDRLSEIFEGDPTYMDLSEETAIIDALNNIPALLLDRDYFMIFDNLQTFDERRNQEGLYWNYWLHVWKTFSTSPFANAVAFVQTTGTISSVAVSPTSLTMKKGTQAQLTANVSVAEGTFASKQVEWVFDSTTTPTSAKTTVTATGVLTIGSDETLTSIKVKAVSVQDGTKTGTATITVTA